MCQAQKVAMTAPGSSGCDTSAASADTTKSLPYDLKWAECLQQLLTSDIADGRLAFSAHGELLLRSIGSPTDVLDVPATRNRARSERSCTG